MKNQKYFANTHKQPLEQYLFAVGYLAYKIVKSFVKEKSLTKSVFIAGCLHDIGKIDPAFQAWIANQTEKKSVPELLDGGEHINKLGKFSFENHPRHNEISTLLYYLLNTAKKREQNRVMHAIYWHHAKPIRKAPFTRFDNIYKKFKKNTDNSELLKTYSVFKQLVDDINMISKNYVMDNPMLLDHFLSCPDEDRLYELDDKLLPAYKRYSEGNEDIQDYTHNIADNARNNLVRAAVISADRLVSALSCEVLNQYIETSRLDSLLTSLLTKKCNLYDEIQICLDGFKQRPNANHKRNTQQTIAAEQLAEKEPEESAVKVLSGAAGCGKTKIALEWAAKTNVKKIIWICPRVQVCQGLIKDLTAAEYLPQTKIELNTGEFKLLYQFGNEPQELPEEASFSGDIVITTIDQVLNTITTHSKVTGLIHYMEAHIVFDEYHEYIAMPAFNLLFSELVECKKLQQEYANVLLVSATPHYFFLEELLEIDRDDIVEVESFNQSDYQIRFDYFDESKHDESNPLYKTQANNTFVISNTAITAQLSFIKNQRYENALLIHSKFKKSDKSLIFNQLFESFKYKGNKEFDVLRAGPIVQASLNISCDQMITEFTTAENWLQRLGRLDRFGQNKQPNLYITAVPDMVKTGKEVGGCARFLGHLNSYRSAKAWRNFLLNNGIDKKPVSLAEIYQCYQDFYDDSDSYDAVEEDLIMALKQSAIMINKQVLDPISFPNRKNAKSRTMRIKRNSLRGNNRFVQMARCEVNEKSELKFLNQYAYDQSDMDANLTASVELIFGYGDSKRDLLSFMVKKHHNIKNTKKSYKDSMTLNEARNPETPIYLSYTPEDLARVQASSHAYALYYVKGIQQVIGAIPINKLMEK